MNKVVVLAVGLSLDLYPGFVHPAERALLTNEPREIGAKLLKKLLACTFKMNSSETISSYHENLQPII